MLLPLSAGIHYEQEDIEEKSKTSGDGVQYLINLLHRRQGIVWALISAFFTCVQVTLLTTYSKRKTIWHGLFIRSVFLSAMTINISWRENSSRSVLDLIVFVMGGILDVIVVVSLVLAGHFIRTGDASSISLNMPIPASLLACMFLREPIDIVDLLCMVVNGIGLVFVSRPSFLFPCSPLSTIVGSSPTIGLFLSFVSLVSSCSLSIICRFLVGRGTEDTYLMVSLSGIAGIGISTLVSSVTSSSSWEFPQGAEEWLLPILIGTSTLLAICPYFKALETEHVMSVTVWLTVAIPLLCMYDFVILHHHLQWEEILGVLLLLGSTFALHGKNEILRRYS